MSVDAVIPACDVLGRKNLDQLDACLSSPCFTNGTFGRVLIAWDGCSDEFVEYFQKKYDFVWALPWLHNKKNRMGFAKNSNQGLGNIRGVRRSAMLINQDCVLPANLSSMFIPGAVVTAKPVQTREEVKTGEEAPEETMSKIPYFCTYIDSQVLEKVGLLEGAFVSSAEDDDHLTRTLLAGFKAFVANVYVQHEGSFIDTSPGWVSASGTYNQERLSRSVGQYLSKWQCQTSHEEALPWILENFVWDDKFQIV